MRSSERGVVDRAKATAATQEQQESRRYVEKGLRVLFFRNGGGEGACRSPPDTFWLRSALRIGTGGVVNLRYGIVLGEESCV